MHYLRKCEPLQNPKATRLNSKIPNDVANPDLWLHFSSIIIYPFFSSRIDLKGKLCILSNKSFICGNGLLNFFVRAFKSLKSTIKRSPLFCLIMKARDAHVPAYPLRMIPAASISFFIVFNFFWATIGNWYGCLIIGFSLSVSITNLVFGIQPMSFFSVENLSLYSSSNCASKFLRR